MRRFSAVTVVECGILARFPRLDRKRPACLLFLVDQSGSMALPARARAPIESKYHLAAKIARLLLGSVWLHRRNDLKEGLQVAVLAYADGVFPLFGYSGRGRTRILRSLADAARYAADDDRRPTAVQRPRGGTAMCLALQRAARVAGRWASRHPQGVPPLVVHVTDGEATDGDPSAAADALRRVGTRRGKALLVNVLLTDGGDDRVVFPSAAAVPGGVVERTLFLMSSPLPPWVRRGARRAGVVIRPGARAFLLNAELPSRPTPPRGGDEPGKSAESTQLRSRRRHV